MLPCSSRVEYNVAIHACQQATLGREWAALLDKFAQPEYERSSYSDACGIRILKCRGSVEEMFRVFFYLVEFVNINDNSVFIMRRT